MTTSCIYYVIAVTLPDIWEPQPTDSAGKPVSMHMFDVAETSQEYQEALRDFHATIKHKVTVLSLKRIQNPGLYAKYLTLQDTLCVKHKMKKVPVKLLFHGSKEDSVKFIATQGFNRSLAAEANGEQYLETMFLCLFFSFSCILWQWSVFCCQCQLFCPKAVCCA